MNTRENSTVQTDNTSDTSVVEVQATEKLEDIAELGHIARLMFAMPENHRKFVMSKVRTLLREAGKSDTETAEETPEMVNTAKLFALNLGSTAKIHFVGTEKGKEYAVTGRDHKRGPNGYVEMVLTADDGETRTLHTKRDISVVAADQGEKGKANYLPGIKVTLRVV